MNKTEEQVLLNSHLFKQELLKLIVEDLKTHGFEINRVVLSNQNLDVMQARVSQFFQRNFNAPSSRWFCNWDFQEKLKVGEAFTDQSGTVNIHIEMPTSFPKLEMVMLRIMNLKHETTIKKFLMGVETIVVCR